VCVPKTPKNPHIDTAKTDKTRFRRFWHYVTCVFLGIDTRNHQTTRRTRRQPYTARPCRISSAWGASGSSGITGASIAPRYGAFVASGSQDICPEIFWKIHIGAALNHWIRNTVIQWASELFQSGHLCSTFTYPITAPMPKPRCSPDRPVLRGSQALQSFGIPGRLMIPSGDQSRL
jgi:hypothetical protein